MTNAQLQAFMARHKLTSEQLAELIGLTGPAVDHWLNGRRSIAKPYGRLIRLFERHPALMKEFR